MSFFKFKYIFHKEIFVPLKIKLWYTDIIFVVMNSAQFFTLLTVRLVGNTKIHAIKLLKIMVFIANFDQCFG